MKKYRLLSILLTSALFSALLPLPALASEAPEVTARHAILVDARYGEVLYEKDARSASAPASITKLMTALLICEAIGRGELSEDQPVTASDTFQEGLHPNGSTANIKPGEVLSVRQLLYCLLLPSANEASNILAEALCGDVDSFVALMNRRARQLGCSDTRFANTHGLDQDGHHTTAYDISLFTAEAMTHPLIREIVSTGVYKMEATNLSGARTFYNTNALLSNWHYIGYTYDKAIGVKTGTTENAGRCLVSAAEDPESEEYLICVVLGAEAGKKADGSTDLRQFSESRALLKWGFQNFKRTTISRGDTPVAQVNVTLSQQADAVMVKPVGEFSRTLPVDMDLDAIESAVTLFRDTVEAPVEEGQVLGSMTLSYGGEVYGTLDLAAVNGVERSEFLYRQAQVKAFFQQRSAQLILASVMILAAIVLLRLLIFRRRRRPVGSRGNRRYSGRR